MYASLLGLEHQAGNKSRFQFLDKDGKFISRLRFSDGFCYTSNFALNTEDKKLLASARHDNIAKLYDLGSQSTANVDLRSRFVD